MLKKAKELFETKGINMEFLNEPKIEAEVKLMEDCWSVAPDVVKSMRMFPDQVSENIFKRISEAKREEVTIINTSPWAHVFYISLSGGFLERNAKAYEVSIETVFRFMLLMATAEYMANN
ncbi:MAG: hypothetical protein IKT74_08570 [Bacteroidales bacterium]|nr:hypothetical protein [Bacteroidales bacterium]